MPVYDQHCLQCGSVFEIMTLSFASPRPCPHCTSADTEQLFLRAPSFRMGQRQFEIKRGPSHNPYENLTLHNIHDEHGKPVKVNSESELRRAEKKLGFVHAASWGLEKEPPQHEKWAGDLTHGYRKKYNRDPAAYTQPDSCKGVSVGVADSPDQTLAHKPNPMTR